MERTTLICDRCGNPAEYDALFNPDEPVSAPYRVRGRDCYATSTRDYCRVCLAVIAAACAPLAQSTTLALPG